MKRALFALAAVAFFCGLTASAQLPGFTITNSGAITLPSQTNGPVTVTVTPVGGFSGPVILACNNMPAYASCKFPQVDAQVNLSGGAVMEKIIINTSQIDEYQTKAAPKGMGRIALATLFAPAACLLFFARKSRIKGATAARLLLCVLALYPLAGLAGCASVKPNGTPPGTYNILITGTYSTISASSVLTLKVT